MAAEERRKRRACAGVGHVAHLETRGMGEHLDRHVQGAIDTGGGKGQSIRLFLAIGHQVLQRLVRRLRAHHQHRRIGGDQRDRHELVAAVGRLAAEQLVRLGDDRDRGQRHQQRVAVGLGIGHRRHADRAACSGLVHDRHRLLEQFLHGLRSRPPGQIGDAARREGHDQGDRPRGIMILRGRRKHREACQQQRDDTQHACLLFVYYLSNLRRCF